MQLKLVELVSKLFKPVADLVDDVHTSDEERLQKGNEALLIRAQVLELALQYEADNLSRRAEIILAEARSDSWIAKNWRPITMLTFLGLTVSDATGLLPFPLRDEAWLGLNIGLGGYVVGRSAEKVAKEFSSK